MVKLEAKKDGKGNIVISEDSFEMLLSCLDNQKNVGDEYTQDIIDNYNRECREMLNQKYVFRTEENGYYLAKRYENQIEDTEWTGEDVGIVYQLFKDTKIADDELGLSSEPNDDGYLVVEKTSRPWLIERPLDMDYEYLTISEDGKLNRPWKQDEIINIEKLFNK